MRTAMVISPHADDAAAFCGGTLARFAAESWKVVLVRVTDDARDSVGLTMDETKQRNAAEMREAAAILGVSEIVELGFPTDSLADVPLGQLRESIVRQFRQHQPYAVFSFDPDQIGEDNMDHVRVAQATAEAFWVSAFDLHYPEHFQEGLAPFSVCERWYFGRELPKANHAVDVTDFLSVKIESLLCHQTQLKHMLHQMVMQARTWGRRVKGFEEAMEGDKRSLVSLFLTEQAKGVGEAWKLGEGRLGEVFRLVRFGDLEPLFQLFSAPLPDAEPPVKRKGLDG
jgi:LmbE family N-acetylglucosaminyl deacetylase